MNIDTVRTWLSVIVVGGFSLIAFLTVLFVLTGLLDSEGGIEILKTFSSVFSGFVGLVVGYYFAREE